jgi:hypothetical protein
VLDCANDASCSCWVDCLEDDANGIDLCIDQCGIPDLNILDLLDCAGDLCEADCGNIGL